MTYIKKSRSKRNNLVRYGAFDWEIVILICFIGIQPFGASTVISPSRSRPKGSGKRPLGKNIRAAMDEALRLAETMVVDPANAAEMTAIKLRLTLLRSELDRLEAVARSIRDLDQNGDVSAPRPWPGLKPPWQGCNQ